MKKITPQKNKKYHQISFYVVITAIFLMIIVEIFLHLPQIGSAIGHGFGWLLGILKPLIGGLAIAYLFYPLVSFFQKKLQQLRFFQKHGKSSRGLAVLFTSLIGFFAVFLLFFVLFSTLNSEIRKFNFDDIGKFLTSITSTIQNFLRQFSKWLSQLNVSSDDLNDILSEISSKGLEYAQKLGDQTLTWLSRLPGILSNILFAIIFAIYFMLDGEGLKRYWSRVLRAISSRKFYHGFRIFLGDMDTVFSGYIRGQLIDATFMFAAISIALSLAHVRFAILIGLLTGIGNLIPYVGPVLAYGSSIIVNLVEMDFRKLVISIIIIFIIQTIDGNIINPKLLSSSISIHPVLVIVSLLIGAAVGGILGMLLAVPVGALIKIEFERGINHLVKHRNIEDSGKGGDPPEKVPEETGTQESAKKSSNDEEPADSESRSSGKESADSEGKSSGRAAADSEEKPAEGTEDSGGKNT